MFVEQKLIGEFRNLKVIEAPLPQDFLENTQRVVDYWEKFKGENPKSTMDSKIRLSGYGVEGGVFTAYLSNGIDFSHLVYSDMLRQKNNLPPSPEDTYLFRDEKFWTKNLFSNALAVGAVLILDPTQSYDPQDKDVRILFNIRSKKQATNPGTLSLIANGYVEEGAIDNHLLEENLFREILEESYIGREEISQMTFVGPCQMRGKSCDFIWIVRSELSYEAWKERWDSKKGQDESSGVMALRPSELNKLYSSDTRDRLVLKMEGIPAHLKEEIKSRGIILNPLVQSLYPVLSEKIPEYLERMR